VEHSETASASAQEHPTGEVLQPASPAPCLFNDLPPALHEYIHTLEGRLAKIEAEQNRFTAALMKAGKFIFDSPQGKMIMAAFPKEAQNGLRNFFNGEQNGNR